MIRNTPKSTTGIALVQVLLITGIISVLLMSLVKLSQQQLNQARAVETAIESDLALLSKANQVKFQLLSNTWTDDPNGWNFYGEPVQWQGITLELQALNGLVPLSYDLGSVTQLLVAAGRSTAQAEKLTQQLAEWQGLYSYASDGTQQAQRLPIQHINELVFIGDWTQSDVNAVRSFVHAYPVPGFNPTYAPSDALDAFTSKTQAQAIRRLRLQQRYTANEFQRITGTEFGEFTSIYPGPLVRIELTNESMQRLMVDVELKPYDNDPIVFYQMNRASTPN